MVAKQNELRRREKLNSKRQKKVNKLESTSAKILKGQGNGNVTAPGPTEKSMLDLDTFMSSPLRDPEQAAEAATTAATTAAISREMCRVKLPRARAARVAPLSPAPNPMREERAAGRAAKRARGNNSNSSPMKASISTTFAKLDEEDISAIEDEVSFASSSVRLGKRHRPGSPLTTTATTATVKGAQDGQESRPARRGRYGATEEGK
ncbi:hypothetical protein D9757_010773 [Collybiopsis confluens]|uniref:Uncharacterized protein n=1 Tax=Collybiopsis confluens TaxID=2823264 RepID=A0A8H5H8L3_9AGAR|nr:hypothetical protein D9757_010773 [Collybiopsis confluens]